MTVLGNGYHTLTYVTPRAIREMRRSLLMGKYRTTIQSKIWTIRAAARLVLASLVLAAMSPQQPRMSVSISSASAMNAPQSAVGGIDVSQLGSLATVVAPAASVASGGEASSLQAVPVAVAP